MIKQKEYSALYERTLVVRKSVNGLDPLSHDQQLDKILDVVESLLIEVVEIGKKVWYPQ